MKIKKNIAVSDTGFLFNPATGDSYSVNPIGMEMVRLMQQDKDKEEIRKVITNQYVCDDSTFEKDFYDFAMVLKNYKLLENE